MRRPLLIAVLALFASNSVAQPLPDSTRIPRYKRYVFGVDGALLFTRGKFRQNVGPLTGGFNAFVGLRWPSGWTVGARLAGAQLDKRKETADLDSGLSVDLKTTTSLTRIGLFGQFGPRLGSLPPDTPLRLLRPPQWGAATGCSATKAKSRH